MPDFMLELKDLTVSYEKVQVLWDISFSIKEGEVVTLLVSCQPCNVVRNI